MTSACWPRSLARLLAAAVCCAPSGTASSQPLDPTVAQELRVGRPGGFAPLFRLDAARSGRTPLALPARPQVIWRQRITGSIDLPAAVDERGAIVVAGASGIVQLSKTGAIEWSRSEPAVSGPVLTTRGERVVLTGSGELLYFTRSGDVVRRLQLASAPLRTDAPLLPLEDGGVLVAAAGDVSRLTPSASVRHVARFNDEVRTLLESPAGLVVTTELGDVHLWSPPHAPRKVGSFAGRVSTGAALGSDRRVIASVDQSRLVELDLSTRSRHVRVSVPGLLFQGAPVLTPTHETRILSFEGTLLGHEAGGQETLRVALTAGAASPDRRPATHFGGAPPLLLDARGACAFALPNAEVGIVDADGDVHTAPEASCIDPVSLVPAGPRRMLLACRSGQLLMIGEATSRRR